MKFSMMLSRFGSLLLACLFIRVADAQEGPAPGGGGDVVVQEIAEAELLPCSCDCCQVADRPKSEEQSFDNGVTLTVKCVPPALDQSEGNARCPSTCKASNADSILTAAVTNMDLSRYCNYKCKPSTQTVGTMCIRLTAKETAATQSADGNGNSDVAIFAPDQVEVGPDGLAAPSAQAPGAAPAAAPAAAEEEGEDNSAHVRWDMRKVIAQRLRAEAGANMARAAATEQRVHSDRYVAKKDKEMAEYAQKVLQPVADKGQEAQVATAAEADTAAEESALTQQHEIEAVVDSKLVVQETKKLVKAAIRKQAMAAAKQEAAADAYMQAWDKPDNWGKTLAVRAASPYLTEMVNAIQRTSEYDGFSRGLLSQAKGAQSQAQTLVMHANQMKAQGDLLGAATEEKKVKLLIGKAKGLEEEANKYWKIADETRKTIPEWQMGGNMAAARAAWEFKVAFTPPPE